MAVRGIIRTRSGRIALILMGDPICDLLKSCAQVDDTQ